MAGISDELEPGILPRQLQGLERLAARLARERPVPSAALGARVEEMLREAGAEAGTSHLLAWACLASGLLLLGLIALIAL
jgi:hypothetical protein